MSTVTVTSDPGRADVATRFHTASGISERRRIPARAYRTVAGRGGRL